MSGKCDNETVDDCVVDPDAEGNWWERNLPRQLGKFEKWLGDAGETSRVMVRRRVREMGYASVLDVGAGLGTLGETLVRERAAGMRYMGVDSCKFLVERMEAEGVEAYRSGLPRLGDDVPGAELVVCRHVLEHLAGLEVALEAFEDLLVHSERELCVVFFILPGSLMVDRNLENGLYHNRYPAGAFEEMLQNAGRRWRWEGVPGDGRQLVLWAECE